MDVHVLLVEDEAKMSESIRDLVSTYFSEAVFTEAVSRREINLILDENADKGYHYDIVIADLNLPGLDGARQIQNDLPNKLRKAFPDASITVYSAHLGESALHELTASGDVHVVEKPFIDNMMNGIMQDLGKTLLSRLRASLGRPLKREAATHHRGRYQSGCSTAHFNRALQDILSVYKDLPQDIKTAIQEYVTITEDNQRLFIDIPKLNK